MFKFLKSIDTIDQNYKLFIFYILNLLDILFTQFFVFTMPDVFKEANPFLKNIINTHTALILKILIPLFLVIYWQKRFNSSTHKDKIRANYAINFILFSFSLINLLHLVNLILYISIV